MSTMRVIFVHGMSAQVIESDYSQQCCGKLRKELVDMGVLRRHATPAEVSDIITFEQVNYSEIGSEAEARVLDAYTQQQESLFSVINVLTEAAGFDKLRRSFVNSLGDVLVYKSDYWRDQIRATLVKKLEPYLATGDPVTIVAHSLGSVVAFDVLYYNLRHNPAWHSTGFKPRNLFTMGSPLALFSMDLDRQSGKRKFRYSSPDGSITFPLVQEQGVWYNFLDAQDLIAYPLEVLFKDRCRVKDIWVQTGTTPFKAHTGYWDNDEVTQIVAQRLALDYAHLVHSEKELEEPVGARS